MKTNLIKLLCGLALLAAVSTQAQSSIDYVLSGTLSGQYNGTDFADKAFTMTISAPLDSISLWREGVYGFGSYNDTEASDIILTVEGVGTSTILAPNTGLFNNLNGSVAGFGGAGGSDYCDFYASEFATYQLGNLASTPVTVVAWDVFDAGADFWSELSYSGTVFQAGVVPAPEPSTLALAGLGALGCVLLFRRRK